MKLVSNFVKMTSPNPMSKANKLKGVPNFNTRKFKMENIFMTNNLWRFTNPNVINSILSDAIEHEMFEQK